MADVIFVVDLAVEQLDANRYAMIFADFLQTVQSRDRILRTLLVRHARAIPRECNHVGNAEFRGNRYVLAERFLDLGMIFDAIERARDVSAARVTHAANQPVAAWNLPFFHLQKVNSLEADLSAVG